MLQNQNLVLRMYVLYIERFGIFTVKLRCKDNVTKCRFFVVPSEGPALCGMPDIEVLCVLEIKCEVIDSQQAGKKFDY